jgi:hypothetical protein
VQVVRGTVVDFMTGKTVSNASLQLKSEYGAELEAPVTTDSNGVFTIHTKQYQKLRLAASAGGYVELTTPAFSVELEEMLTVEVILASDRQPAAPIALVRRELPRLYSATDFGGYGFRRRRALAGTFFDASEIARSGAGTLTELLRGVPNVKVSGGPDAPSISFAVAPQALPGARKGMVLVSGPPSCNPMYFLNGELQREPDTTVRPLQLSQLRAVELYPQAADVPFVFRMGSTGCGVIVVWTRDWAK